MNSMTLSKFFFFLDIHALFNTNYRLIKHLLNVKHQNETYFEHRQVSLTINCHYMDTYFTA